MPIRDNRSSLPAFVCQVTSPPRQPEAQTDRRLSFAEYMCEMVAQLPSIRRLQANGPAPAKRSPDARRGATNRVRRAFFGAKS
jgi:hypothetical protein